MELTPSKSQSKSSISTSSATPQPSASSVLTDLKLPVLDSGDLGQLQELLFGNQLLTISNHLDALRHYIDEQLATVRKEYTDQIASLREHIDVELTKVVQKQQNRDTDMSTKLTKTDNMLEKIHLQLSSQISDVGTRLTIDLMAKNEAIQHRIDDAIHQLSQEKMDRSALSGLLSDVASQLANNAKSPVETGNKMHAQRAKDNVNQTKEY